MALPTPELLQARLRYEPETGLLHWVDGPRKGREAFTYVSAGGYRVGNISGVLYAHRVIWAVVTGSWPHNEVDHINGDRLDNRWRNLREATSRENKLNRAIRSDNSHGVPGICLHPKGQKRWQAVISTPAQRKLSLGYFSTKEEAVSARRAAEVAQGYSERHGR